MTRCRYSLCCLWLALLSGWGSRFCNGLTISEERRKYLKAESLAETGFEAANLKAILDILLRNVIWEDPDLAHELVFHTERLIRLDQARNRESFFNEEQPPPGKTHLSEFIDFFEVNDESLNAIGVMVRTFRNDYQNQLPFSGQRNESRGFALLSQFVNLGGNYDVPQAMDLLQKDLRLACGEGNSLFLAPYFLELAYHLRPAQRQRLAEWAAVRESDPGVTASSTAKAILLGLALFEAAEKVGGASNAPQGERLDATILDVMQNASMPLSWRLGFASLICSQMPEPTPPLRNEAAHLLTNALETKLPVPAEVRVNILNTFLKGPNEDGAWLELASRLVRVAAAAGELASAELNRSPSIEFRWISQRLDLLCRVARPEEVPGFLYTYSLNSQLYPSLWITLIANRRFDLARQLFDAHGQTTPFKTSRLHRETYSKRLEEALPDYLATLANADDRALAELLAIAAPDPEKRENNGPLADRQERFRKFAAKYSASPPRWNREQQLRAAEVFSFSEGIPWMSEWLRKREIGLVARIQQPEPKIDPYWAGRIEMHHAAEKLESGQTLPLLMMWGRAVDEDDRILETRRRFLTEALISLADARLESALKRRDGEKASQILHFSRQLISSYPEKIPNQVNSRQLLQFSVKALIAHAIFGEMDAWNAAWDALDPARSSHLVALLKKSGDPLAAIVGLLNPERARPQEAIPGPGRFQALAAIFQNKWVNQGLPASSVIAGLTAGSLLDPPDLLPMAECLARHAPREGSAWREYLGALAEWGGLREALATAEREMARPDLDQSLRHALLIEKLIILKTLKLEPEYRELEKSLSVRALKLPREYQAAVNGLKLR